MLFEFKRGYLFAGVVIALWLLMLWPLPVAAQEIAGTVPPAGKTQIFLPVVQVPVQETEIIPADPCPATSTRVYNVIPIEPPVGDHPDELHGDLNLSLRGYTEVTAERSLIHINGPTDTHAPQLPGLFADARTPTFTSTYRVYDWNWGCGEHGCVSPNLVPAAVSLLGVGTTPGEEISIPSRQPEIYGGGYKVLVLYASEDRITLGYTRRDSVAPGYAVHLEKLCVDPNLVALYRASNIAGRGHLPALHNGDVLGIAPHDEILVAMRDRGTFMDSRSRKDWWKGR